MAVSPIRKWTAYAAGKKVYRSGSSAPTQGTVNPTGYVERSLAASTSRSGLASAALRRIQALKPAATPTAAVKDVRVPTSKTWYPSASVKPSSTGALTFNRLNVANRATTATKAAATATTNRTTALAGLKEKRLAATQRNDTALPFDAQASDQRARAIRDRDERLAQLEEAIANEAQGYTLTRRNTEEAEPNKLEQILNAFAGRGMAFSGSYGKALGDESRDFAGRLGKIESAHTESKSGFEKNRSTYERNYTDQLQDIYWDQARRLADKGGDTDFAAGVKKTREENKAKNIAAATTKMATRSKSIVKPKSRTLSTAAQRALAAKRKK